MKLKDVLAVISGGTHIKIYADLKLIFKGEMAAIQKTVFEETVGPHLDSEVYRLNTVDGYITIAV